MIGYEQDRTTAQNYQRFAEREASGKSPLYAELALGVAGDTEVLARIDSLPLHKRQPNLVLAAVRLLHGTPSGYAEFRRVVLSRWSEVRSVALARATQTNEVGRCAALVPVLAELPQPIALVEVGASAGLCLLLDHYRYDYGPAAPRLGPADGPVTLSCELRAGTRPPARLPRVVSRIGLDLAPVDVTDRDAVAWLEALVWPGQDARLHRLRAAVRVASADPPPVIVGDLRADLTRLVRAVAEHATVVVLHSAVLPYLPEADRTAFIEHVSTLPAVRIAYEAPDVLPLSDTPTTPPEGSPSAFLVCRDRAPVAWADSHGAWFRRI